MRREGGFRVSCKGHKYHTKQVELCVDECFSHLRDMIMKEESSSCQVEHALGG